MSAWQITRTLQDKFYVGEDVTDTVDVDKRSKIMAKVRSTGTKLEQRFVAILKERSLDGLEEQPKDIEGHPDFAVRDKRVAIFVHSCFWHGCPNHLRMPASNRDYWEKKIARNQARDKTVKGSLREQGWFVVTIWEHEIKANAPSLKAKLTRLTNRLQKLSDES